MPTILYVRGWRFFFYSNERNEPVHVHAQKGDCECKYWIDSQLYNIEEAYAHNSTPRLRREVRKIIFEHLEYIVDEWERYFRG
jgi:hypothetical protein